MTYPPSQPPQSPPFGPNDYQPPSKDADHLKALSICWRIVAVLQCLGSCGSFASLIFSVYLVINAHTRDDHTTAIFLSFACVFLLILSAVLAFLSFKVGKSLKERAHRTLCLVMAVLLCTSVPLGTILGIFTLVVLARPTVKGSFH